MKSLYQTAAPLKVCVITPGPSPFRVLLSRYRQLDPSGAHTPSPLIPHQYGSIFCWRWHTYTFLALTLCPGRPPLELKWSQFLPPWRSLRHLLSKTCRSIIGLSWRRVSGTQQITVGCRPGSFVALLWAERDGVNADKHWRTRVIYYTSIKHSANTAPAAGTSLSLTGLCSHTAAPHQILQLLIITIITSLESLKSTYRQTVICQITDIKAVVTEAVWEETWPITGLFRESVFLLAVPQMKRCCSESCSGQIWSVLEFNRDTKIP